MPDRLARRNLLLLIAEDDAIFAGYLVTVLSGLFARIEVIASLAAVQQRLTTDRVDAVLLDLTLTDSRGLAPIQTIRRGHPYLPLVVITAGEITAREAKAAGACEYLHKTEILPNAVPDPAQLIFDTVIAAVARRATQRAVDGAGVHEAVEAQSEVQEQIRANLKKGSQ